MALKKDKKKVIGEEFDDDRIRSFLDNKPYGEQSPSYHLLEKAYRGMKANNFETFLQFFMDAGYDINARDASGRTFLQNIKQPRHAADYLVALKKAGAR